MTQNNIKKITLSCITLVAPIFIFGQQVATQAAVTQSNGIDLNSVLLFVAAFLLIPLYITGNTFIFAAKKYATDTKKESSTLKKTGTLILLFFCYQALQAQLPATNATPSDTNWSAWIITMVIVLESLLIVIFSSQSLKFISRSSVDGTQPSVAKNRWLQNFWNKINSFKPIAEESDIDTGHSYDGIRELDNITPPWFVTGFALTIIFAAIYLYRY
ncbi:MAG: hypothetical protein NTW54_13560, partial [Bacteroidetes bacterium]|nr:hypothetical protein [Bacteroidota bacterium]